MLKLKVVAVAVAAILVFVGAMMFGQARDLRKNYTLVDASVVSVSIDCFIEAGRKKVVMDGTRDLAYMDCALAPGVAAHHGFRARDVRQRARIGYEYTSPVDRNVYRGSYVRTGDVDRYVVGRTIRVHAHRSEPENSRTTAGNVFIEDTGA